MTSLQDRLQQFLLKLDIPMRQFERDCGIGQGLGSKLSIKSYATTFNRIATAYPQLNIDWLKTGNGEMLKQTSGDYIQQKGKINVGKVSGSVSVGDSQLEIERLNREIASLNEKLSLKDDMILQLKERVSHLEKTNNFLMSQAMGHNPS